MAKEPSELFEYYLGVMQGLLAEAEVEFEILPVGVLERTEEFLYHIALASQHPENRGYFIDLAERSLEQARFYCWYHLTERYAEQAEGFYEELHVRDDDGVLRDVDDGELVREIRSQRRRAKALVADAYGALEEEEDRIYREPSLSGRPYAAVERVLLERASRDGGIRDRFEAACDATRAYCRLFVGNQGRVSAALDELALRTRQNVLDLDGQCADLLGELVNLARLTA